MSEMEALFKQIGGSAASSKGDNFRDGRGVVVIKELICRKMNEGNTFVAATKVVSSSSKGDLVGGAPVEPNAVGTSPSWPQKMEKFKSAMGNVKMFTLRLLGFQEAQVTPDQFAEAFGRLCSKEQPARGMLIGYETYQQATRTGPNAGKINTYVSWVHVPPTAGNAPAEIKKRREELDKTDPIQN